jgi:hypothetical protein
MESCTLVSCYTSFSVVPLPFFLPNRTHFIRRNLSGQGQVRYKLFSISQIYFHSELLAFLKITFLLLEFIKIVSTWGWIGLASTAFKN